MGAYTLCSKSDWRKSRIGFAWRERCTSFPAERRSSLGPRGLHGLRMLLEPPGGRLKYLSLLASVAWISGSRYGGGRIPLSFFSCMADLGKRCLRFSMFFSPTNTTSRGQYGISEERGKLTGGMVVRRRKAWTLSNSFAMQSNSPFTCANISHNQK